MAVTYWELTLSGAMLGVLVVVFNLIDQQLCKVELLSSFNKKKVKFERLPNLTNNTQLGNGGDRIWTKLCQSQKSIYFHLPCPFCSEISFKEVQYLHWLYNVYIMCSMNI